jgi:hypothetical protein
MLSMGGTLGLYGDLGVATRGPAGAIAATDAGKASATGVGIDPEGIDQNPAYVRMAWRRAAWRGVAPAVLGSPARRLLPPASRSPLACGKLCPTLAL